MRKILILILIATAFIGCSRRVYVPVESVRTEYRDRANEVVVHDSVTDNRLIYIQGDTVIDWRERVRWRNSEVHDTLIQIVRDSVPVPYPVEKKLTRWEQTKMELGGIAMGGMGIALLIALLLLLKLRARTKI